MNSNNIKGIILADRKGSNTQYKTVALFEKQNLARKGDTYVALDNSMGVSSLLSCSTSRMCSEDNDVYEAAERWDRSMGDKDFKTQSYNVGEFYITAQMEDGIVKAPDSPINPGTKVDYPDQQILDKFNRIDSDSDCLSLGYMNNDKSLQLKYDIKNQVNSTQGNGFIGASGSGKSSLMYSLIKSLQGTKRYKNNEIVQIVNCPTNDLLHSCSNSQLYDNDPETREMNEKLGRRGGYDKKTTVILETNNFRVDTSFNAMTDSDKSLIIEYIEKSLEKPTQAEMLENVFYSKCTNRAKSFDELIDELRIAADGELDERKNLQKKYSFNVSHGAPMKNLISVLGRINRDLKLLNNNEQLLNDVLLSEIQNNKKTFSLC